MSAIFNDICLSEVFTDWCLTYYSLAGTCFCLHYSTDPQTIVRRQFSLTGICLCNLPTDSLTSIYLQYSLTGIWLHISLTCIVCVINLLILSAVFTDWCLSAVFIDKSFSAVFTY